jgi:capsular polysaccharide biosynthesis protein
MVSIGSTLRRRGRLGVRKLERTAQEVKAAVTRNAGHLHREHPYAPVHLSNYLELVNARHPRAIVLLTDGTGSARRDLISACRAAFPGVLLLVVRLTSEEVQLPEAKRWVHHLQIRDPSELYHLLWRLEPFEVVIDFTKQAETRGQTLLNCIYAVPEHGLYVIHHLPPDGAFSAESLQECLEGHEHQQRAAAKAHQRGQSWVVHKQGIHYYKLRDRDLSGDEFQSRLAPRWGRTLLRVPAKQFESRARVTVNDPAYRVRFQESMPVKPHHLREYLDVVCHPRQEVVREHLTMPISYHHPNRKVQHTMTGTSIDLEVDWMSKPAAPAWETFEGPLFHLISAFPGHFGHFMTEDLGRMWGWRNAKERFPDLKLLISAKPPREEVAPFQKVLLEALGVGPDDVVCINQPVRVKRLIGASPQFHNRRFIDPDLSAIWDEVRDVLAPVPDPDSPKRVFITRPEGGQRRCLNSAEVEQRFTEAGFALVRPELLSTPDQVKLFSNAAVVAGYGGSGMFGSIFAREPGRRIVISSSQYTASNEYLISSVKGDEYVHFWCDAELNHPASGWSVEAFWSNYTFDFDRDGAMLDRALAD